MNAQPEQLRPRLERYRGFLAQDPENAGLAGEVADLHLHLGEFAEARQVLEKALASHPGHPQLLNTLASVAIASNQPVEAAKILQDLLQGGHDNPIIRYNLAYALVLGRHYTEARDILLPVVDDPRAPEAPVLLARCLHYLGDLDEAIERLTAFAARHPNHGEALGILSLLHLDAMHADAARTAAEQALRANADDLGALVTLGSLSLETQDDATATGYFEHALRRHPRSGRAWSGLGLAAMLRLDLDKAIEQLRHAVEHMPDHIGTWHALAWCQLMKNDIDGAKTSFERSMEIDRNFGETHGGLAVIAVLQNRPQDAEGHLKRALRLNPVSFAARFAQSLMAARNDPAKAREIMDGILASSLAPGMEPLRDIIKRNILKHQPKRPESGP